MTGAAKQRPRDGRRQAEATGPGAGLRMRSDGVAALPFVLSAEILSLQRAPRASGSFLLTPLYLLAALPLAARCLPFAAAGAAAGAGLLRLRFDPRWRSLAAGPVALLHSVQIGSRSWFLYVHLEQTQLPDAGLAAAAACDSDRSATLLVLACGVNSASRHGAASQFLAVVACGKSGM